MKAARLAEPGERFFIMGAPPGMQANGDTGTALAIVRDNVTIKPEPFTSFLLLTEKFMIVDIDNMAGLKSDTSYALPRRWLYALIDDDNDAEDAEPIKKAVSA